VTGIPYRSYVAIGDSLSEGLGDFNFDAAREHSGWTDRLAAMLSLEAQSFGTEFQYANLALRGSKLRKIMTEQLHAALRLQPDLVTIMAGSNDLMTREKNLPELERVFREGLELLLAAGCEVVVANTINPIHLRVFKKLAPKAQRMTNLIERVAGELGIRVIDVHRIDSFADICFWAEDMVHFSGHGHVKVANRAAEVLGLSHRMPEASHLEMTPPDRSLYGTLKWIYVWVIPFFERRLKGTSSGDGMLPKHLELAPYSPNEFVILPGERKAFIAREPELEPAFAA
jgi:lysophospholipase L1-like esterase